MSTKIVKNTLRARPCLSVLRFSQWDPMYHCRNPLWPFIPVFLDYNTLTIKKFSPTFRNHLLRPPLPYQSKHASEFKQCIIQANRRSRVKSPRILHLGTTYNVKRYGQIFMNCEWARWGFGRSWPVSKYYLWVNLQRLKKKQSTQDRQYHDWDSTRVPSQYKLLRYLHPFGVWTLWWC